jgi:hypothetical protein
MLLEPHSEPRGSRRLYSLCLFERGWIVPHVRFLHAENDLDALALAKSLDPWMTREVWDEHRLVDVLPPTSAAPATVFA